MRENRISWNDYNMLLALTTATRSPDPNTQVGAYICSSDHVMLGSGYNGTPRGIDPTEIPWTREADSPLDTKYPFIVHAERNAILNSSADLSGASLYVTMHPCNECAIEIIQKQIKEVIYLTNPYKDTWPTQAASWMLSQAGVKVWQHRWHNKTALLENLRSILALV